MLASLHVQNFKCLRDVEVAFGPFTVLIGLNDSGKSSILDALRLLGRTVLEPIAPRFRGPMSRACLPGKRVSGLSVLCHQSYGIWSWVPGVTP